MSRERFDVIVVGARCAGSALACHLAHAGLSVVALDAARMPSPQNTSTHLIQPPGMDELDALGVGASVRELCPALSQIRLCFDEQEAPLAYGPGRAAHCLRRETLDSLLQRAALEAGAELRDQSHVVAVERSGEGRVTGVQTQRRDGSSEQLSATLVVGADGRNSTIATPASPHAASRRAVRRDWEHGWRAGTSPTTLVLDVRTLRIDPAASETGFALQATQKEGPHEDSEP